MSKENVCILCSKEFPSSLELYEHVKECFPWKDDSENESETKEGK